MTDASGWVDLAFQLVALVVVSVGALWAYTRYALERGLLAPASFNIEVEAFEPDQLVPGVPRDRRIISVLLQVRNRGTSTLVLKNLRVDVRYLASSDPIVLGTDPKHSLFGRVQFSNSVLSDMHPAAPRDDLVGQTSASKPQRGFLLLKYDTFVQSGVDQTYTFVTSVPTSAQYVLAWGSFEYAQRPGYLQKVVLRISRRLGLVQFSLTHVQIPHTAETVVQIGTADGATSSESHLAEDRPEHDDR
ncbi:hypothetical protein [Cellulomonas sp. Root137]|uniref:hypothetical protein n=1 Tax=Cellulomonas sp. Root137 TaxID=1736459 RepID=UPI0006F34EE5|nr:hypothetical protein [Cellulomonas sp. Root137]KQY44348.1 hypothetical protein ASD18_12455 [Cellulomonas sp. Root137]